MEVILFSEDLKTIHDKEFKPSVICNIEKIESFPAGLITINGKLARCCSIKNKETLTIEYMETPIDEEKIFQHHEIKCPYCGVESSDSWEASDTDTIECDICESTYKYERIVDVSYTSTLIEKNTKITELKAQ